jgi:hypothetical protein
MIKKIFGVVFMGIGTYGVFCTPPVLGLLALVGLILFLQGIQETVIEEVVECIRSNKSYDELLAHRRAEASKSTSMQSDQK